MSRNHVSNSLASEIEARLLESASSPEPIYTYDEPARLVLAQIYSLLLSEKRGADSHADTADGRAAALSYMGVQDE